MNSKLQIGGVMMVVLLGLIFSSGTSWVSAQEQKKEGAGDVQERAVPMQKFRFSDVPRLQGSRTPIPPRGGTMNFSCGVTSCTCRGDADCNNMFSSNVCGGSAVCDTGSGECSCLRY
jgi:hypothetical protein